MSTIIEVEKLKKTFRSFQLHDIAFHVSEGCITGLIGIDGSGKSTIIKCLINLIQRDSGKVEFWGENINDKNYSVMNRVGTILSGNEFYDGLTGSSSKLPSARMRFGSDVGAKHSVSCSATLVDSSVCINPSFSVFLTEFPR